MLKHLVFDCDGVLWDGTNEGYCLCYHRAALEAGLALDYELARQRILDRWGQSATSEVAGMIPEHPERMADVLAHYQRLIRSDLFLSTARLVDGVEGVLGELSGRYALSAITGMNAQNLQRLMERFGLGHYFRHTLSTGDSEDPQRQKTTGYHLGELLRQESLGPEEVICVGDALADVQMARRQGVPIVIVLTGHLTADEARRLEVDAILPSVAELPEWLRGRA